MILFFFLSILGRKKFLNVAKLSSLYNHSIVLFLHNGTCFIKNKCTDKIANFSIIKTSHWDVKIFFPIFFFQGSSSRNRNAFLAFNIIFKSFSDILYMDFAKSMLLSNNSGDIER